ncbi:hypothetical protein BJX96DRAFT_178196 [Aspergillus floccosus]
MWFLPYAIFVLSSWGALAQDEAVSLDGALLSSQAEALKSAFPSATPYTVPFRVPGGNLLQPPASVAAGIITGVPATVIAQLALPAGRSSIQSEFRAGNTPAWYQDLPAVVKEYVNSMHSQVAAGAVNLRATPTEVSSTVASEVSTGETASGSSKEHAAAAVATSTSSGLAPQATGKLSGSLTGALGLLGLLLIP